MKPVEIEGKKYLYRPVDMSVLQPFTETLYPHGAKIIEADYNKDRQDIVDDIHFLNVDLRRLQAQRDILEDKYTLGSTSSYDEAAWISST